ncbi:MAG: hypothetical protein IKC52_02705 [Clostridia bacterium]|nr:hypothetical protein [Clostridia bacterium]
MTLFELNKKHHIVAKRAWMAAPARYFLYRAGIRIDDRNLAKVPKGRHRVLHTKIYYTTINLGLFFAYSVGGEKGVELMLYVFKTILEAGES